MRKLFLLSLVIWTSPMAQAAGSTANTPQATPASPGLEQVKAGELRLDGQISAVLGAGIWQINAISWTSPRGVTTNFDEVKAKAVQLAPDATIHPLHSMAKVDLNNVKLKSNIAVIGKNGPDGTILVREVIVLEGYNGVKSVGILSCNPESLRIIEQSRHARDMGQLPKALELAKRAAQTAAGQGDFSGEALCTQDIAILYRQLKDSSNAMEAFKHEEALGQQLNNSLAQVLGLEGQGMILGDMGQNDQSIALLVRSAALSTTTPVAMQIAVLKELMAIYSHVKKWNEATEVLVRLFPLQESQGQYDDATTTLLIMAATQCSVDMNAAKNSLEQARTRVANIHDESRRLPLTVLLASALKLTGDFTGATEQYEVAAKLATAKGDIQKADLYRAFADNPKASPSANLEGDWTTVT